MVMLLPGYADPSVSDNELIITREILTRWLTDLSLMSSRGEFANADEVVVGPQDGRDGTARLVVGDGALVVGRFGTIQTLEPSTDGWVLRLRDGAPRYVDTRTFSLNWLGTGRWS